MLHLLVCFAFLAQGAWLIKAEEVCYPPCGCFSDDEPFDNRPLPESPREQRLSWHLFTRLNPDTPVMVEIPENGTEIEMPDEYDPSKPTKWIAHGWNAGPRGMYEMKDAFLQFFDVNVMVIDWQRGALSVYYPSSASNSRVVGACSANLSALFHDGDLSQQHCVGFSLGGQVCSYMGKESEGEMQRVTGLDPAGPWFSANDSLLRIDIDDAQFVDTINTDGQGFLSFGLGQAISHVDFFPNNADRQPPCPDPSCDHGISVRYWINSIVYNDTCPYRAYPCQSTDDSDNCQCETCVPGEDCQLMGYYADQYPGCQCETCVPGEDCQLMGYFADQYPGRGTFFLRTTEVPPYCEHPGTGICANATFGYLY